MPTGPLGGPRPFADSRLVYTVSIRGDTSLAKSNDMDSLIDDIGKILMAVNDLDSGLTGNDAGYNLGNFRINRQGLEDNLTEGTTEWKAEYELWGSTELADYSASVTRARKMKEAYEVLVEENDEPIRRAAEIRSFDPGDFSIEGIRVECG